MMSRSYANLLDLSGDAPLFTKPMVKGSRGSMTRSATATGALSDVIKDEETSVTSESPSSIAQERIIVVANALPLHAQRNAANDGWEFTWDEDALLLQMKDGIPDDMDVVYVGSLKVDVDAAEQDKVAAVLLDKFNCVPTFLSQELKSRFYHGFCKQQLWPLFHYMLPLSPKHGARFDRDLWQAYVQANKIFSDKVMEVISPDDDFVWVHDYHLMVLPTFLRKRFNRIRLGFFLHSPFPSSEIYRTLPVRDEILRALLNADLIGFHTFDYARHFLSCCSRMLGLEYESKRGYIGLQYYGRTVGIKIMPVGVHLGQLAAGLGLPDTEWRMGELKAQFSGRAVLLGVDDMDIFKGIDLKLLAMEQLLQEHPEWVGKAVMVQLANPARGRGSEIEEYQQEVQSIARRINAEFGREGYEPVVLLLRHVPQYERLAFLSLADCLVVTAVRDGMNLCPYEYVVCRQGPSKQSGAGNGAMLGAARGVTEARGGASAASARVGASGESGSGERGEAGVVLVPPAAAAAGAAAAGVGGGLGGGAMVAVAVEGKRKSAIVVSEFVGCSPSLSGAIRVNPWNVQAVADAMNSGLTMGALEQEVRHEKHLKYVREHDVAYWAQSFLNDLQRTCREHSRLRCYGIGFGLGFRTVALDPNFRKLQTDFITRIFQRSRCRVLLLDYDGTMMPQTSINKTPSAEVIEVLNLLCNDPRNIVFIVSGRRREVMAEWFCGVEKLGIAAEHGYFFRWNRSSPWETSVAAIDMAWMEAALPVLELYTESTDGSYVETKESALVWHHRDADPDFGSWQAKELLDHLESVLANEPVSVKSGHHIVEVKPQGVSKGVIVEQLLAMVSRNTKQHPDFILCIGDDRSDEDMFERLEAMTPSSAASPITDVFACTVGQKPSKARYYLDDTTEVMKMLGSLAHVSEDSGFHEGLLPAGQVLPSYSEESELNLEEEATLGKL